MTFVVPNTEVPQLKKIAAEILVESNAIIDSLIERQRQSFKRFWFDEHNRQRSVDDVNGILSSMDEASPGQSLLFVSSSWELAQLILKMKPNALSPVEYSPAYTLDTSNGVARFR